MDTGEISKELLHKFNKKEQPQPAGQAALASNDLNHLLYIPDQGRKLNGAFTFEVDTHGITNQKESGRCWLFAALNLLREEAALKLNAASFEFSENYLAFFDKLEKANNFLESIIAHADEPADSRYNDYLLGGLGDGNVWTHAVYLLKKYGAVPKEAMPETYQSEHTDGFWKYANLLLRKDASVLRQRIAEGKPAADLKEQMLDEIYHMEVLCFGMPPETFDYSWRDKDNVFHEIHDCSPGAFLKNYTDTDLDQLVHVVNEPDHLMYQLTSYHCKDCAVDEERVRLNLPMEEIEELVITSLRNGRPVWFGCESRLWEDGTRGIWDPDSFSANDLFNADFTLSKAESLKYHAAYAAHNMLITGVHINENGRPDRWKIENSWGEENGRKGIFIASEKYFKEYVFEAAVSRQYMNARQLEALRSEAVKKEVWEIETWN